MRVEFSIPQHGWIEMKIETPDASLTINASSVPYNSIQGLTGALALILKGGGSATVVWNEEPVEYDFRFADSGSLTTLDIVRFGGQARKRGDGVPAFSHAGTRLEICLPFWRALRRLQSQCELDKFKSDWGHDFPNEKLEELTRLIEAEKAND